MKEFTDLWLELARQKIAQAVSPQVAAEQGLLPTSNNTSADGKGEKGIGDISLVVAPSTALFILATVAVVLLLACFVFYWQIIYYRSTIEELQDKLMMLENRDGEGWMARVEPLLNDWGDQVHRIREELQQLAESLRQHPHPS